MMSQRGATITFADPPQAVTVFGAASYPEFQVSELEDENDELDQLLGVQSEVQAKDVGERLRAGKLSAQEGLRAYFGDQSETDSD